MNFEPILQNVKAYYDQKLEEHGPTANGVDWNSLDSQHLRFAQLLKVCSPADTPFSILDYGCGYGALATYMAQQGYKFAYDGFDISEKMVESARGLFPDQEQYNFTANLAEVKPKDYVVASGIFNVRQESSDEEWLSYIIDTLHTMDALSNKGFSFNVLTKYSDPPYMRSYLYYADPLSLFDYCKQHFSKWVALLHDYPLYEFTLVVRKSE